jgi:hypothetical protein
MCRIARSKDGVPVLTPGGRTHSTTSLRPRRPPLPVGRQAECPPLSCLQAGWPMNPAAREEQSVSTSRICRALLVRAIFTRERQARIPIPAYRHGRSIRTFDSPSNSKSVGNWVGYFCVKYLYIVDLNGTPEWIRTTDLLLRRTRRSISIASVASSSASTTDWGERLRTSMSSP